MQGCHIDFNKAGVSGGGIWVEKAESKAVVTVSVEDCQFLKNDAGWGGGALAFLEVGGGSVALNLPVEGNNGKEKGGGFSFWGCDLSKGKLGVAGNFFKGNTSREGRDIFCGDCPGADKSTLETNNSAAGMANVDVFVFKNRKK